MNSDSPAESEIIEVCSQWADAMLANDSDQIGSFMSDGWVMVSERGISTKAHFMSSVRSGTLTHSRFEMLGEPRVRIYGETAIVSARVVNTAHFGGETFEADEWTSDVFVRVTGKWQCVLSQISQAAIAP